MRTAVGDLLDQPVFGHGCNTVGSMGGGIAKQVRHRYPALHQEYLERCRTRTFRLGDAWAWEAPDGQLVYNLATQVEKGRNARLDGVRGSVTAMLEDAAVRGLAEVAVPRRLGSGIGGLDWDEVRAVLEELDAASGVDLVVVRQPELS